VTSHWPAAIRIRVWARGEHGELAESAARITDHVVSRCFSIRDTRNYSAAGDNARPFRHVLVLDLIYASAFEMSRKPQNRHGVSAGDYGGARAPYLPIGGSTRAFIARVVYRRHTRAFRTLAPE